MSDKAIILLSGGLDSITILALAKQQGYSCYALSFEYGQKHNAELEAARKIAQQYDVIEHKIIKLDMGEIGGSALTDDKINVPESLQNGIPVTYVPARNTVFLALALGWAEVINAKAIFIGVNAVDYSGYPDCRPDFLDSFANTVALGTKAGVEGAGFEVVAPLLRMNKSEIIRLGLSLGVDYAMTRSCYDPKDDGTPCGHCDSCHFRNQGFAELGKTDPLLG